jgi:hypothetical protein
MKGIGTNRCNIVVTWLDIRIALVIGVIVYFVEEWKLIAQVT